MFRIKIDMPLLFGLLLLCASSLFILWSAGGEDPALIVKQAIRMGMAIFGMIVLAQIRPDALFRWTPFIYTAGLLMLAMVLVAGDVGKGAQRWLDLGIVRFQPSEVMKLAVPMMVAWVVTRKTLPPNLKNLIFATLALAVPAAFIVVQPDLGTAILIVMSGALIIFLAGFSWRNILILAALALVLIPLAYLFVLEPYQQRRIQTLSLIHI